MPPSGNTQYCSKLLLWNWYEFDSQKQLLTVGGCHNTNIFIVKEHFLEKVSYSGWVKTFPVFVYLWSCWADKQQWGASWGFTPKLQLCQQQGPRHRLLWYWYLIPLQWDNVNKKIFLLRRYLLWLDTIRIYFIKYTLFNDNLLNYCHFIHFGFRFFAPCVNNVELICWSYIKCLDWGQRSDATAGHSDFINISEARSAFFVRSWNVNIYIFYLGFFVERIVIHSQTKIIAW